MPRLLGVARTSSVACSIAVLVAALVVTSAGPVAAGSSGAGQVQTTELHVALASQGTTLHEVGADGEHTYGWNHLTGTAPSDSGDVAVDMQGAVDYTRGEGTFTGFVTLTFASQAQVGLKMRGTTTRTPDGGSEFSAKLRVIGGTGAMIGAKGVGTWTGTRSGELGSPVEADFTVKIRGVDLG